MTRQRRTRDSVLSLMVAAMILVAGSAGDSDMNRLDAAAVGGSGLDVIVDTSLEVDTLRYYLSRWNDAADNTINDSDVTYYGEGLPDVLFRASAANSSLILLDLARCLGDFPLITCMKFLLVKQLDALDDCMAEANATQGDVSLAYGILRLEKVPGKEAAAPEDGEPLGLDEDISRKVVNLFGERSLRISLLPGVGLDVSPAAGSGRFLSFRARPYVEWSRFWRNDAASDSPGSEARKKQKGGFGFKMPNMMILPQLIMLGFMPFALANLQAMVMNAFMLNMMALNSAIFMTIRNLVFGPRGGPKIKYVNYGYRKKHKSSVPTVIVHSPAAFVKQPFRHRKRPHHHHHRGPPLPEILHGHLAESVFHVDGDSPELHHHDSGPGPDFVHHADSGPEFHHVGFHPENPARHHGLGVDLAPAGSHRVRVRIPDGSGSPSLRQVLHRIRTIEENRLSGPAVSASASAYDSTGQSAPSGTSHEVGGFEPIVGRPSLVS